MQAAGIGLFLLCGQTILSLLGTVAPSGGGIIPVEIDESAQFATLTYTSFPRNGGLLAAEIKVGFGVDLYDGSYSNRNNTTLYLKPGEERVVSLILRIPVSVLSTYSEAKGYLGIYTDVSTLGGLAGIAYNALAEGG